MHRIITLLSLFALAGCAGLPAPQPVGGGDMDAVSAAGETPSIKLKVRAELRLGEFSKEVEFGMLNATQGNYVRTFPEEGFSVIVNLLPVIDPGQPSVIDCQYQVEIGEGSEQKKGRVIQIQNEYLFEEGKPRYVLESEDARVALTFWKAD